MGAGGSGGEVSQSRSGYIINQISRGAEKVLSGEWDRREYDQPAKLPYRPESLALFRTLLDLDVRTATPDDVESLRVPIPVPDDASILRHLRAIVTSRQSEMGQERSSIFEAFMSVYSRCLSDVAEQPAFRAATGGLAYLEGYVNPSVLEAIQFELEEIRGVALSRAEREMLAQQYL